MRIRTRTNVAIQILSLAAHVGVLVGGMLTGAAGEAAMIIAASAQAIAGILAHRSNPDGTPVSVAYRPEP